MFHGNIKPKIIYNEYLINQITSKLGISPYLVEFIFENNFYFLVFEFIESDNFKVILNEYSFGEKMEFLLKISEVLKRFHDLGFVHRDIKPQNFLYNKRDNKAFLIDFGLSEFNNKNTISSNIPETTKQILKIYEKFAKKHLSKKHSMGTEGFIAPEIYLNRLQYVSQKSDIWSLGIILMQLLFKKQIIFSPHIFVLNPENRKVKNISKHSIILILQLSGVFGIEYMKKYLSFMGFEIFIPEFEKKEDISKVRYSF
jgi:serine/threonine protein kinase